MKTSTNVLPSGARQLLAQAVELEAEVFPAGMRGLKLPDGRDRVVRHALRPERVIQTGIGQDGAYRGIAVAGHGSPDGLQARHRSLEDPAQAERGNQLPKVVAGVTVRDGTEVIERPSTRAA